MLKSELLEILANGENSGVEFKSDNIRPEQLAKEIVALANFRGGSVILGVEDNGEISGLKRQNTEEWVMNVVSKKVHPAIFPFYEEIRISEVVQVAVLSLPQGDSKPYVRRHNNAEEVFIRIGSTSRRATREQHMRLFETGGMLQTETLAVQRTSFETLDKVRLENYFEDLLGDPDIPQSRGDWEKRLASLGLLVEKGGAASVAGTVLFGKKPRQYLKQSGLRIFAFNSTDKEYRAELDIILNAPLVARMDFSQDIRQVIDDGLVEKAMSIIDPFVSEELNELVDNIRREKIYHYPPVAIREIIINACVHRDWTRSIDIEIGIYSDRFEVISPGSLHNSMTIEKMLAGMRHSRNTIIMEIMRDYGYIDFRGMGIRSKVIPAMKKYNGREPLFEATDDFVKVTLPKREVV